MDRIDLCMNALDTILKTQNEDKCRKNVFETIVKLIIEHP